MVGYVDNDATSKLADLIRGDPDAAWVGAHRVDKVGGDRSRIVVYLPDRFGPLFQDRVGIEPDRTRGQRLQDVGVDLANDDVDSDPRTQVLEGCFDAG